MGVVAIEKFPLFCCWERWSLARLWRVSNATKSILNRKTLGSITFVSVPGSLPDNYIKGGHKEAGEKNITSRTKRPQKKKKVIIAFSAMAISAGRLFLKVFYFIIFFCFYQKNKRGMYKNFSFKCGRLHTRLGEETKNSGRWRRQQWRARAVDLNPSQRWRTNFLMIFNLTWNWWLLVSSHQAICFLEKLQIEICVLQQEPTALNNLD